MSSRSLSPSFSPSCLSKSGIHDPEIPRFRILRFIDDYSADDIRSITHVSPSELAVKIASTEMNSCPGMIRSDSSVPSGHIDDIGGKSGI